MAKMYPVPFWGAWGFEDFRKTPSKPNILHNTSRVLNRDQTLCFQWIGIGHENYESIFQAVQTQLNTRVLRYNEMPYIMESRRVPAADAPKRDPMLWKCA